MQTPIRDLDRIIYSGYEPSSRIRKLFEKAQICAMDHVGDRASDAVMQAEFDEQIGRLIGAANLTDAQTLFFFEHGYPSKNAAPQTEHEKTVAAVHMATPAGTIDCTPTWRGIMPLLITSIIEGSDNGRKVAIEELYRLADFADKRREG